MAEGGVFHCDRCGNRVRVNPGQRMPKCPNCGNGSYDSRHGRNKRVAGDIAATTRTKVVHW